MEESERNQIKIVVNGNRTFFKDPGISLLQALKEENIFVPSACGGRGMCGLCRLKVLAGAPAEFTAAELTHLNAEEQKTGIRLACQVKIYQANGMGEHDLSVSIPESFFNVREFKAKVNEIRDLTRDIKEARLELLKPPAISFKSGQYIQLRIPPYQGNKKIAYRAYSIASPPSANTLIELEVRRVRNGIATTYIFDHLKKGANIAFNGPHGDFFLREGAGDIVMIAGGSGMAPIKSMLCDMQERKIARRTRYFFGARTPADLFYRDLMRQLEAALPHFQFIPTVNQASPEDKWDGETGRITDVLERRLEDGFTGEAYLCGSPAMVSACVGILCRKKVSEDHIFYDKFA